MSGLGAKERAAIEAVAKHFAGTWEAGNAAHGLHLEIGRKRIGVAIVAIKMKPPSVARAPRLRFDRVVLRLVGDVKETLRADAPDGRALVFTLSAPIRLASKTATAIEEKARSLLARAPRAEIKADIHGNRVRIRCFTHGIRGAAKVIGFVHNPDTDPALLMALTESLIVGLGAAARTRATSSASRWLVIASDLPPFLAQTCRHVFEQLSLPMPFERIVMVFGGGRVERLGG